MTNKAPVAADDTGQDARGRPEIPGHRNDRDSDDPDGYRTRVLVAKPPTTGPPNLGPT